MLSYRFSKSAEKDFENIAVYSIKNFGITQARLYRDGLFKTFDMICTFPMIGSNQNHIKKNVRRQVYESHSIYYRIDANAIFILRILGPGEDPLRHLT